MSRTFHDFRIETDEDSLVKRIFIDGEEQKYVTACDIRLHPDEVPQVRLEYIGMIINTHLPRATVERADGRWVEDNPQKSVTSRLIRCSECGLTFIVPSTLPYSKWVKDRLYCQKCGARMVKNELGTEERV